MPHDESHPKEITAVEFDILNESEIPWTWTTLRDLPFSRCIWCNQSMETLEEYNANRVRKDKFVQVRDHMAAEHSEQWAIRIFEWLTTDHDDE